MAKVEYQFLLAQVPLALCCDQVKRRDQPQKARQRVAAPAVQFTTNLPVQPPYRLRTLCSCTLGLHSHIPQSLKQLQMPLLQSLMFVLSLFTSFRLERHALLANTHNESVFILRPRTSDIGNHRRLFRSFTISYTNRKRVEGVRHLSYIHGLECAKNVKVARSMT